MAVRKRTWKTSKGEQREAWLVDYYANGERHVEQFERKGEADSRAAEIKVDQDKGVHVPTSKSMTVAEAGKAWIDNAKALDLQRATVYEYQLRLNHILPKLGTVKLCDLTFEMVQAFQNSFKTRATGRKVLGALSAILKEARAPRNPARELLEVRAGRRTKADQKSPLEVGVDIPRPNEINALVAAAGPRWQVFILVAAMTGLRASELRGLRWSDVDLDKGLVHVRQRADCYNVMDLPKSKAGQRSVPIGPFVINRLREWRLQSKFELVFANSAGHATHHTNILKRGINPAFKKAGLPYSGLHCLRHFFCSLKISEGMNIKGVQTIMGHASAMMTLDRYGHLFPKEIDRDALAASETAIFGQQHNSNIRLVSR
jgi:integrase